MPKGRSRNIARPAATIVAAAANAAAISAPESKPKSKSRRCKTRCSVACVRAMTAPARTKCIREFTSPTAKTASKEPSATTANIMLSPPARCVNAPNNIETPSAHKAPAHTSSKIVKIIAAQATIGTIMVSPNGTRSATRHNSNVITGTKTSSHNEEIEPVKVGAKRATNAAPKTTTSAHNANRAISFDQSSRAATRSRSCSCAHFSPSIAVPAATKIVPGAILRTTGATSRCACNRAREVRCSLTTRLGTRAASCDNSSATVFSRAVKTTRRVIRTTLRVLERVTVVAAFASEERTESFGARAKLRFMRALAATKSSSTSERICCTRPPSRYAARTASREAFSSALQRAFSRTTSCVANANETVKLRRAKRDFKRFAARIIKVSRAKFALLRNAATFDRTSAFAALRVLEVRVRTFGIDEIVARRKVALVARCCVKNHALSSRDKRTSVSSCDKARAWAFRSESYSGVTRAAASSRRVCVASRSSNEVARGATISRVATAPRRKSLSPSGKRAERALHNNSVHNSSKTA